ncbi:acyl-CoA dehydrogenase NM domain-like protein [Mycena maculata]|uniref:Acyl-CoA dehydrogenase NM domain-like protein n=1 Tax=Mycena maculata TaxID=230809 RepID=A0AAD7IW73_9AGAR|nr:acyl-CoA dehydrogenase NM domain-like protein [Mycena maculata]
MDRQSTTSLTAPLAKSQLFALQPEDLPVAQRIDTSYLRAQAIARAYKLTAEDVMTLSPKFWAMHTDNIAAVDIAPMALLTIQYNLAAGTIAPWAVKRPELRPILQKILDFEASGQFMLTEQAHGLDAINMETRADMMDDGSFIFNTPNDGAAKFMPPTIPLPNISLPRYAVVFAKLFVKGEDRGVRPFVVQLSTAKALKPGVRSRMIPERAGAGPLGHSVTWFDHIKLAPWACLGPLDKPKNPKAAFQAAVWRISIGGLALGALAVPSVGVSAYILGRYSLRRQVVSANTGKLMPIIDFRTQQIPILHALAQMFVMQAFMKGSSVLKTFSDFTTDAPVRAGISAAAKAVMMMHIQESCYHLSDRVGAQGLYGHSQIINIQLEMRGASIAEGDTLVLCIRLATELLIGRYQLPPPKYMNTLAARHEAGLFKECREELAKMGGKHRSEAFNRLLLPRCKGLVEAIGQRFFYEAAKDAGMEQAVLDVYEASIVKHSPVWFAVHAGMDGSAQAAHEDAAITAALPHLERWLQWSGAHDYALAPIMTQDRWDAFLRGFPFFRGADIVEAEVMSARAML